MDGGDHVNQHLQSIHKQYDTIHKHLGLALRRTSIIYQTYDNTGFGPRTMLIFFL